MNSAGLNSYREISRYASVGDASPHRLIGLMLDGVLARVNEARGHIERGETAAKNEKIGKALRLLEGLHISLDKERGGDIAANLEQLYDYMAHALLRANLEGSVVPLDEVLALTREIKSGWEAIAQTEAG